VQNHPARKLSVAADNDTDDLQDSTIKPVFNFSWVRLGGTNRQEVAELRIGRLGELHGKYIAASLIEPQDNQKRAFRGVRFFLPNFFLHICCILSLLSRPRLVSTDPGRFRPRSKVLVCAWTFNPGADQNLFEPDWLRTIKLCSKPSRSIREPGYHARSSITCTEKTPSSILPQTRGPWRFTMLYKAKFEKSEKTRTSTLQSVGSLPTGALKNEYSLMSTGFLYDSLKGVPGHRW
jgi:hypothetical protein